MPWLSCMSSLSVQGKRRKGKETTLFCLWFPYVLFGKIIILIFHSVKCSMYNWQALYGGNSMILEKHVPVLLVCLFVFSLKIWAFYGNLWTKGNHLMETSYLKAHAFWSRYPVWTSNFHSDRSQDSNPCARGSQGLKSESGSTVPRRVSKCQ